MGRAVLDTLGCMKDSFSFPVSISRGDARRAKHTRLSRGRERVLRERSGEPSSLYPHLRCRTAAALLGVKNEPLD